MVRFAVIAIAAASWFATPAAYAEVPPCDDCADAPADGDDEPEKPGTFFIAEGQAGFSTFGTGGPTFGGLFGAGGRLGSFPPLFYLVGGVLMSRGEREGSVDGGLAFREAHETLDLGVGPRIYVPVFGPFRIYGDVMVGSTHLSMSYDRPDLGRVETSGWTRAVIAGVGAQARVLHHLSVGARAQWTFNADSTLFVDSESVGHGPKRRAAFTGTLTAHF